MVLIWLALRSCHNLQLLSRPMAIDNRARAGRSERQTRTTQGEKQRPVAPVQVWHQRLCLPMPMLLD